MFAITWEPIDCSRLEAMLADPACGAFVCFEGRVRDHHGGRPVLRLEYEAYAELALREGRRILAEIQSEYRLHELHCAHRIGRLAIGDIAIWMGASAPHRGEAFAAVDRAMTAVKSRVPIWKREFYADGSDAWVVCHEGAGH